MVRSDSDIATTALDIDRLMRRIHAQLQLRADDFDRYNVGPIGGMVLLTIGHNGQLEVQTISQAIGRDKSQVSRLIKRLEQKGLIEKDRSPTDGRSTLLRLTEDGQQQLEWITDALSSIIEEILKPLSGTEKEDFAKILSKIV